MTWSDLYKSGVGYCTWGTYVDLPGCSADQELKHPGCHPGLAHVLCGVPGRFPTRRFTNRCFTTLDISLPRHFPTKTFHYQDISLLKTFHYQDVLLLQTFHYFGHFPTKMFLLSSLYIYCWTCFSFR